MHDQNRVGGGGGLAESRPFDVLRLFDTNGDTPRLIFERKSGFSNIIDPEAYESFLGKGRIAER